LVASLIFVLSAHPFHSENEEDEYDEFSKYGCHVEEGNLLFYDDAFVRNLTNDEQKENEKYQAEMEKHNEAFEKFLESAPVDEHGFVNFSGSNLPNYPNDPSFCEGLEKVDLGDCFVLNGKLYKDNKPKRDLTEDEKKKLEEYSKLQQKSFEEWFNGIFEALYIMPLERRLPRLRVVEEEAEDDGDRESTSKLVPLFEEEDNECSVNENLSRNSPSSQRPPDREATLESFRHEWKAELDSKNKVVKSNEIKPVPPRLPKTQPEQVKFEKASSLFLEGVELERRGEMCDAVQRYMAANSPDSRGRVRSRSRSDPIDGVEEDSDLEGTLQRRLNDRGTMIEPDRYGDVCPFALLPAELLMTIVKYVVGSELDVRCLEMLSMTCAGFYLISRDEELWRTICQRVFGEHRITSEDETVYGCWRQVYISRPHVYLHGVYIGKCTYIRHGEASFQDQFYRPWHIVVYYRFMKFFADGTALMITSSEKPAQIVSQLKSKSTRLSGVLLGRYRPIGQDRIAAQVSQRTVFLHL
uniref:F-box only protein 11 n=1 Tax=Toxocara canis TaxID=6265 RepID=A0A183V650_TOXCA